MTSQPTIDRPPDRPTTDRPTGVTLDQAAAELGLSREAVRLRVRRGTLPGERVDGRWVVYLNGWSVGATTHATSATDRPGRPRRPARRDAEVARLEQFVATLERERSELREDLDARRREVQELHILLGRAQGLVLEAGDAPTAHAPPPPRRPWWRRLFHKRRDNRANG